MKQWKRVCASGELDPERPLGLEIGGKQIGIFVDNGICHALNDVCSHAYALLSTGWVEDGAVECPLHGARFDLRTGECVSSPCYGSVEAYQVRIAANGDVLLLVDESGNAIARAESDLAGT